MVKLPRAATRPSFVQDTRKPIRRLKGSLTTIRPLFRHVGEPLLNEYKALKAWLKVRPVDGSDFLFVSQKGGRLCRETITRLFKSAAEQASAERVAAGKPPINSRCLHVHTLKHSRASHAVGKVDIMLIKQVLGHKSLSSTLVYANPSDQTACREMQRATMEMF